MPVRNSFVGSVTSFSILLAPLCGCTSQTQEPVVETQPVVPDSVSVNETLPAGAVEGDTPAPGLTDRAAGVWQASKDATGTGWNVLTEKTQTGLVIVGEQLGKGKQKTLDASTTAWVWSKDRSARGWEWVTENAAGAAEWATDSASDLWKVTKQESGEFSLWVRVEVNDGVAWTRTTLPEAWKVTKDAGGEAWIWIDDHKVEVSVAAAVVTLVVGALIVAPQTVAIAVVKGAVMGTGSQAVQFLVKVWQNRKPEIDLNSITQTVFVDIGKSVLAQSGPQILASFSGAE